MREWAESGLSVTILPVTQAGHQGRGDNSDNTDSSDDGRHQAGASSNNVQKQVRRRPIRRPGQRKVSRVIGVSISVQCLSRARSQWVTVRVSGSGSEQQMVCV